MDAVSLNFHALLIMWFHHLLFVMLNLSSLVYEAVFAVGVTNISSDCFLYYRANM